jgi:hypothetical protein
VSGELKSQNKLALATVLMLNLAVYLAAVRSRPISVGAWTEVLENPTALLPATVGILLSGLLSGQIPAEAKARLVFWRWKDPLPGSRAFTLYVRADPRIDVERLQGKVGDFPVSPNEQNALWYRLYRTVADHPAVTQAHREFLFFRDYATLSFLALAILGVAGMLQIPSLSLAALYLAALLAQFLLSARAAKVHGIRFVGTVLALKSAEP